jgi:hypothetical protein
MGLVHNAFYDMAISGDVAFISSEIHTESAQENEKRPSIFLLIHQ